jgi:pyruvate/2-oxoglutarate dehydrogenase complex dihydrolipoamide dehydrogenase (E3) component
MLETSVSGVYAVGDAAGNCSTAQAIAEGELAAEAALSGAGLADALERAAALSVARPPAVWWDANAIPDDVQVDREEQISAAEIRQAIREGAVSVNDVKRRTRAGMGVSQGIYSTRTIVAMIHAQAGVPLADLTPMTARPPARLLPLAELAAGFVE